MRILNWNTQIATPCGVNGRFEAIQDILTGIRVINRYDPEILILSDHDGVLINAWTFHSLK